MYDLYILCHGEQGSLEVATVGTWGLLPVRQALPVHQVCVWHLTGMCHASSVQMHINATGSYLTEVLICELRVNSSCPAAPMANYNQF